MLDATHHVGKTLDFDGWVQAAAAFLAPWKAVEPDAVVIEFRWVWRDGTLTESAFEVCDAHGEPFMDDASGFALTAHQKLQQAPVEDPFFNGMAHLAEQAAGTQLHSKEGTVFVDLEFIHGADGVKILVAIQEGYNGHQTISTHTYPELFGTLPAKV